MSLFKAQMTTFCFNDTIDILLKWIVYFDLVDAKLNSMEGIGSSAKTLIFAAVSTQVWKKIFQDGIKSWENLQQKS